MNLSRFWSVPPHRERIRWPSIDARPGLRLPRRRLVAVATTVITLTAAPAALAVHVDSMFPTNNYSYNCPDDSFGSLRFCQTDNDDLTVWRQSSLSLTGKSNIKSSLDNEFAPTDLSVIYVSEPSYSGGAETDIIYQERDNLPGGNAGVTWCNDGVSSTKCDQHYVAFESASPATPLTCHETGHAVGLTHGADASPALSNTDSSLACMKKPNSTTSDLGTHNTNMINATYPN